MSKDYRERKNSYEKKNETANKAVDKDDDKLVLCFFTSEYKKKIKKTK